MLRKYFSDLVQSWVGVMSGVVCLVLTIASIYSTFFAGEKGIAHAKIYLWVASAVTFVIANYRAWLTQKKATDSLSMLLNDRRPKLELSAEFVLWIYDRDQNITVFALSATVLNAGEPSVARGYQATYTVGQSVEEMVGFYLRGEYPMTIGNETIVLTNAHLLQSMTLTNRIERGDAKSGRLIFVVPGDRAPQILSSQYKITLRCYDYQGTASYFEFIPTSKPVSGIKLLPHEQTTIRPVQLKPNEAIGLLPDEVMPPE